MRPQLEHWPLPHLYDGGQDHGCGQFGLLTAGSKTFKVFKICSILVSFLRRLKLGWRWWWCFDDIHPRSAASFKVVELPWNLRMLWADFYSFSFPHLGICLWTHINISLNGHELWKKQSNLHQAGRWFWADFCIQRTVLSGLKNKSIYHKF